MKPNNAYILAIAGAILGIMLASTVSLLEVRKEAEILVQKEQLAILTAVLGFAALAFILHIRHDRKTEKVLLDHQHRLASIIDCLPDATWVIDANGVVIAWNRATEDLTGVKAADVIGKGNHEYALPFYGERRPMLLDLAIKPDDELARKYVSLIRRNDTVAAEIFSPRFHPGGRFWWATARRLLDTNGHVIGAIETIRDITEQKRFQEVMLQTEKMLMAGGLAAGMAHEINNPLGVILQNIQNIQRRTSSGLPVNERVAAEIGVDFGKVQLYLKQRGVFELLDMIAAAGAKAADTVAKISSFSQKSSAHLEPVRLEQLVDNAMELAACDYDIKKRYDFQAFRITRNYDRNIPAVMINNSEMEQALINLIINAVQAMGPATVGYTPQIDLRTFLRDGYAAIEITDNGCGMTEATRQRIFEPFYTTKEVGIGTGLGLPITYSLVTKNHHGRIEVNSTPGQGSRFTVYLPLASGDKA